MDMVEYQLEAVKTCHPQADLLYVLGKVTVEGGEAFQHVLKQVYHDKPLDRDAIVDELGDVLWYLANAAHMLGASLEYVAVCNVEKLRKRHGEQYNPAFYGKGKE